MAGSRPHLKTEAQGGNAHSWTRDIILGGRRGHCPQVWGWDQGRQGMVGAGFGKGCEGQEGCISQKKKIRENALPSVHKQGRRTSDVEEDEALSSEFFASVVTLPTSLKFLTSRWGLGE